MNNGKIFRWSLGVLVGDAFGLTFQFTSRLAMELNYPKPKEIPMLDGLWSDDSSLTLATAHALTEGYSIERIAENFLRWYYDGEFTPRGYAFDQGNTTSRAIERIANGVPPLEAGGRREWDNGNGSLMRILPAAYYAYFKPSPLEERLKLIHEVSMITHAHPRSLIGCGIYSLIVWNILKGMDKPEACTKTLEIRYWEKSQEDSGNEVGRENEEDIFLLKSLVLEKMVELALAYAKYNDKAGVIKVLERVQRNNFPILQRGRECY